MKCVEERIETEAVFTNREMNIKWDIDFLHDSAHAI